MRRPGTLRAGTPVAEAERGRALASGALDAAVLSEQHAEGNAFQAATGRFLLHGLKSVVED